MFLSFVFFKYSWIIFNVLNLLPYNVRNFLGLPFLATSPQNLRVSNISLSIKNLFGEKVCDERCPPLQLMSQFDNIQVQFFIQRSPLCQFCCQVPYKNSSFKMNTRHNDVCMTFSLSVFPSVFVPNPVFDPGLCSHHHKHNPVRSCVIECNWS